MKILNTFLFGIFVLGLIGSQAWAQTMKFPSAGSPGPGNVNSQKPTTSSTSLGGSTFPNSGTSNPPTTVGGSTPSPQATAPVSNEPVELDPNTKLILNEEQVSSVFRDMVVVQRKAKDKGQKFLIAPSLSFEFSDGPKAMYPFNLDIGYAVSDFWEIYLNYVPSFLVKNRAIVDKVAQLKTADGKNASIDSSDPKSQVGINVLWVPAYGKDSWGPYRIIRSDTFIKFGFANVSYASGSGNRLNLMVGKTYFLSHYLNFRLALGSMSIESYSTSNGSTPQKNTDTVIIMESGLVFYF